MKCPATDPKFGLNCLNVKGHEGNHICDAGTWDNEARFPTMPCAVQYELNEHESYGCYLAVGHPGMHQIRVHGETVNWISQDEHDKFQSVRR